MLLIPLPTFIFGFLLGLNEFRQPARAGFATAVYRLVWFILAAGFLLGGLVWMALCVLTFMPEWRSPLN
ncbi:hypothetical protein ACFL26_00825 [Patescibacteria group bacterium]